MESGSLEPEPPRARKLRVIGKEPLANIIDVAVSKALREEGQAFDRGRMREVQDRVRRYFAEMIHTHGKRIRGVPKSEFMRELQLSRDRIKAERERTGNELSELKQHAGVLREVRTEARASELREQDESNDRLAGAQLELRRRFRAILEQSRGASPRLISEELARAATDLMREESLREAQLRASRAEEQIQRFERRIAKLNESLVSTEAALSNLSKLKEGDSDGIASIYRTVQGLGSSDDGFALKRAALEEIFSANLTLQTNMA